jgi:hypothetical protein
VKEEGKRINANTNKKFWDEIICIHNAICMHKLTVNNIQCSPLRTKFHPNPPVLITIVKMVFKKVGELNTNRPYHKQGC